MNTPHGCRDMAKSTNTRVKFLVVWAEGLPVYMLKYGRTPGGPEMGRPARNVGGAEPFGVL